MENSMEKIVKRLLFVLFLSFVFLSVGAQSKPKRNVTKDRKPVTSVPKVQKSIPRFENKVAMNSPRKNIRNSSFRHKKRSSKTLRRRHSLATYLYVDGRKNVSLNIGHFSSKVKHLVSTDGQDWTVTNLPSWCSYVKTSSNSFMLYTLANSEYEDRSSYFYVVADDQYLRVDITQTAVPFDVTNIKATTSTMYLNHNCSSSLLVYATIYVQNAKGIELIPVVFINDGTGSPVKASNSWNSYAMAGSGDVYVAGNTIKPTANSSQSFTVSMYLPNNAMQLRKKKNELRCYLCLYCPRTRSYVTGSAYVDFKAKVKRGNVITSSY